MAAAEATSKGIPAPSQWKPAIAGAAATARVDGWCSRWVRQHGGHGAPAALPASEAPAWWCQSSGLLDGHRWGCWDLAWIRKPVCLAFMSNRCLGFVARKFCPAMDGAGKLKLGVADGGLQKNVYRSITKQFLCASVCPWVAI